ncbi:MAG: spore coat protein CotJB, partial [Oscillospiraceae bacterium]|nr:spore coat protein CotJB [Oscillospiraceae bacterium]
MKNRNQLMQVIRKYDFALYDLSLYLDTHTQCREALQLYRKYRTLRQAAMDEYV